MRRIGYLRAVDESPPPNRILEVRESLGMTQVELARRAHVHPSAINKVENGDRGLSQQWMRRLAPHLGVSPADLLPDQDNPDRLSEPERALVLAYRSADAVQRKQIFSMLQTLLRPDQLEDLQKVA
jgi:transcriptional regulator with XRE-family HTH domain